MWEEKQLDRATLPPGERHSVVRERDGDGDGLQVTFLEETQDLSPISPSSASEADPGCAGTG